MVTKIIDEKEKWPPAFGSHDSRIAHQLIELEQKRQNKSQCSKCNQNQNPGAKKENTTIPPPPPEPQFKPPFGSFMKDMYDLTNPSVFDFPTDEFII
jgi:hypothetical protein